MASAMRVQEEEDITDDDILIPGPKRQRREGTRKATAIGNLSLEIAVRENPKRGGTRSATAANTAAAGNDDAIPKAAVPSRVSAKRAPATRGPQARRHKTSGLRPSVRPKLEDDKFKTKLGADDNVTKNPMRTRANNLYLLGISKENSELITANGASHLARFLEAKKTNIQPEDVKKEPIKVEEKASVIVAELQISQVGGINGLASTLPQRQEASTPPSSISSKMSNKIGKADTGNVRQECSSPHVKAENEGPNDKCAPWNITKAALRPNKKISAGGPAPIGNHTPSRNSPATVLPKKASTGSIPSGQKVVTLNYTAGTDPFKSRKLSLFDDAHSSAMATVALTPSLRFPPAGAYGQSSSTSSGPHNSAKRHRLRTPCGSCHTTGVQTHHRGPTGYNLCALCNKEWGAKGKPSVWRGVSSGSMDEGDDEDELGHDTLVNEDTPTAFGGADLRLGLWQSPARSQEQEHSSIKRVHAATGLLGDDPPRKAQRTTSTIPRQLSLEVGEHPRNVGPKVPASGNEEVHDAVSAAKVSVAAQISKGAGPCGLCKTSNPSGPVQYSLGKSQKDGARQLYCHRCYMKDYMRRRKKPAMNHLHDMDEGAVEEDDDAEESTEKCENGGKVVDGAQTVEAGLSKPTVELYTTLCGKLFDLEKLEKEDQARLVVGLKAVECAEAKRTSDQTALASLVEELKKTESTVNNLRLQLVDHASIASWDNFLGLFESLRKVQDARRKAEDDFYELVTTGFEVQGTEPPEQAVQRYQKDLENTTRELQVVKEQLKKLAGRGS